MPKIKEKLLILQIYPIIFVKQIRNMPPSTDHKNVCWGQDKEIFQTCLRSIMDGFYQILFYETSPLKLILIILKKTPDVVNKWTSRNIIVFNIKGHTTSCCKGIWIKKFKVETRVQFLLIDELYLPKTFVLPNNGCPSTDYPVLFLPDQGASSNILHRAVEAYVFTHLSLENRGQNFCMK